MYSTIDYTLVILASVVSSAATVAILALAKWLLRDQDRNLLA